VNHVMSQHLLRHLRPQREVCVMCKQVRTQSMRAMMREEQKEQGEQSFPVGVVGWE